MRRGLVILLIAFVCVGCGSGQRSVHVSGDVSYKGQAVEEGEIAFVPLVPTPGPAASAAIRAGHYDIPAKDNLLAGGTYSVEVRGLRKARRKLADPLNPAGPALEVQENYIPPEYNVRSRLKVTVATDASEQRLDFALPLAR
jgi:hypothetical protein